MNNITHAYLACALWSSTDEDGTPLDSNYTLDDIAPEAIQQAQSDCDQFVRQAGDWLFGWTDDQIGHDFWLTRNRHGAGFWDRNMPTGEELTKLAHEFGEVYVYVGDDNRLYFA